ncbi:MAG: hypothetical protein QOG57_5905 [Pseudonocardiales bacterium]|jgi:gentisate 1,2-dioxygenase|nr:hypothetical protein [Pseudonocardiales bacterium]
MTTTEQLSAFDLDPTVAAPVVDVSRFGFEGPLDEAAAEYARDARFFEYTKAANPLATGTISAVPATRFGAELYADGPTRRVPLDIAAQLGIESGPATSPGLLASFLRIRAGESYDTAPNATSELYYVLRGRGYSRLGDRAVRWEKGDFLTLPAGTVASHRAESDAALYWVTDEPLLRHLGATATRPRFRPTKFGREAATAELRRIAEQPGANEKNRVSVLLANAEEEQTLTITHVLWAMLGLLPAAQVQRPHRHQSVALDLILDCQPGCYTVLGDRLDERGEIVNPRRVDWEPGGAFITPPGMWHSHVNESGADAHLVPVQDAGLQTYLRALDIRFTDRR